MFAGHVGAALALHPLDRRLPPGALIGAALLLDLVLWVLVLAGQERILVPEAYARHHYLMFDFPWSHGLLAAVLWAAAAGIAGATLLAGPVSRRAGAVIAAAVLSHWVLDALLHVRGLPLLGPESPKVGLGLWEHVPLAALVEGTITAAGAWLFLRGSGARRPLAFIGFVALLFVFTVAGEVVGPPPRDPAMLAVASLVTDAIVIATGGVLARRALGVP
jgi:hypothetical protein